MCDFLEEMFFPVGVTIISVFLGFTLFLTDTDEDIASITTGKHYSTECKLLEVNINNGFFSGNTNKLDCGGVITHVSTVDYDASISAYNASTAPNFLN